jgi:8-oxo-dGTP diphosphatase
MSSCIDVTIPPLTGNRSLLLVAAAVLIDAEGRMLLAQRPEGKSMAGLWEFPGGKVHTGETAEAALVRELKEELGVITSTGCLWPLTFASYSYPDFHLLMPLFGCRQWQGVPEGQEGQELAWVAKQHFKDYPMPPADIALVQTLWQLL